MSNINVYLSTTKHTVATEGIIFESYKEANVPVCTANLSIMMFGMVGPEAERMEHEVAESCMKMAKTVSVDSKTRRVYIGLNPADEESGLVEYVGNGGGAYENDFFQRWDEIQRMIFEFVVFGQDPKNARFAVKGVWDKTKWAKLEVIPNPTVIVNNPKA